MTTMTLQLIEPYAAQISGADGLFSLLFKNLYPMIGWSQGCELLPLPVRCNQDYIDGMVGVVATYNPTSTVAQILAQMDKGVVALVDHDVLDNIVHFLVENPDGTTVLESLAYIARQCPVTLVRLLLTKVVFELLGATIGIGQDLDSPVRMVVIKKICRIVETKLAEPAICDTNSSVRMLAMRCWTAQLKGFPEHYLIKETSLRLQLMCFDLSETIQQKTALKALTSFVSSDWTVDRFVECFEEGFLANVILVAKHDTNLQTRLAALGLIIAMMRQKRAAPDTYSLLQPLFLGLNDHIFGTEQKCLLTILDMAIEEELSARDTVENDRKINSSDLEDDSIFQERLGECETSGSLVIKTMRDVLGFDYVDKSAQVSTDSVSFSHHRRIPALISVICRVIGSEPLCSETIRLANFLPKRLDWVELCRFIAATDGENSAELQVGIMLLKQAEALKDTSVTIKTVWKVIDEILSKAIPSQYDVLMVCPLVNCDPNSIQPETESPELLYKFYKTVLLTDLDKSFLSSQTFAGPMRLIISAPSCKRAFLSVFDNDRDKIRHDIMATIYDFPWDEVQLENGEKGGLQTLCILFQQSEECLLASDIDGFFALADRIDFILSNNKIEDSPTLSKALKYMGRLHFALRSDQHKASIPLPDLNEAQLEKAVCELAGGKFVSKGYTEWLHCRLIALETLGVLEHGQSSVLPSGLDYYQGVKYHFV